MLRTTRQTAVKARLPRCRSCATRSSPPPTKVRDPIRNLTLRQLIRALAASRPEARKFRDPPIATGVALRSLAHRILELGDEIHNLDATQRAARGRARPAIGEREQYVSLAFGQAAATPASLARWAPRATASPLSP